MTLAGVVDSHCHLADAAFAGDLPEVVSRARAAGLESALCILSADEPEEVDRAAAVRDAWPTVVFAAAIHPHRAASYAGRPVDAAAAAASAIERSEAVALGEIGLDYHYDFAPREVQQEVFAAQASLAVERERPVIIHTREAADDTYAILRDTPGVRGVMHCFSGTRDEAREALDHGYYISLSGILTFPRASNLRELATFVPEDRLLVETDAPFLAPVPHRGHRNEPAWVVLTLAALANARQAAVEVLTDRLAANYQAFLTGKDGARAR
jgi:TatD DNase family protein